MDKQLVSLFLTATILLIVLGFYPTASGKGSDNNDRVITNNDISSNTPYNVAIYSRNRNLSNLGYKPVPDTCPYIEDEGILNDNFLYKEWCEKTFDNGSYIYEAYKNIAFNIEYTPEPSKTDFWQTPLETFKLKKGDCEDAVFHFFSQLLPNQRNAEITWGWVINKHDTVGKAHVWYQLIDKNGEQYVVEGFSKDWDGIIPVRMMKDTEARIPILTIVHSSVSRLANLSTESEFETNYENLGYFLETQHYYSNYNRINYPQNAQGKFLEHPTRYDMYLKESNEVCNILKKLRELLSRYESQREDLNTDIPITCKSKTKDIFPGNNLICKR